MGGIQGVQLDRLVATLYAPLGESSVVIWATEPPWFFVTAHGTGVGEDFVPIAPQQLIDRLIKAATRKIPQGHVRYADHIVCEVSMDALPVLKPLPQFFTIEWVFPNQRGFEDPLHDGGAATKA